MHYARGSRHETLGEDDEGMANGKAKRVKCDDCFFHQNKLCALNQPAPCTTFRPAERGLAPESQLAFAFRADRTRSAYAFPPPGSGSEAAVAR